MGAFKWIFILGVLGVVVYFTLPHLWMVSSIVPVMEEVVEPPQVDVSDINLKGIGTEGIVVDVVLKITNPNRLPMTFDRATFNVYIDDEYVGRGTFPGIQISGYSTQLIDTETVVSWGGGLKGMWNVFRGSISGSGSTLTIDGTAYLDVPVLGTVSIPFSSSKRI